jgi:hypothetical protein
MYEILHGLVYKERQGEKDWHFGHLLSRDLGSLDGERGVLLSCSPFDTPLYQKEGKKSFG